jgi:hypothetical protein
MKMVMMMLMKMHMMTMPEGDGVHRSQFQQRFPPLVFSGGGMLTLYLCDFDLRRRSLNETLDGRIYRGFRSKQVGSRKIEANLTDEAKNSTGDVP